MSHTTTKMQLIPQSGSPLSHMPSAGCETHLPFFTKGNNIGVCSEERFLRARLIPDRHDRCEHQLACISSRIKGDAFGTECAQPLLRLCVTLVAIAIPA
ncbi:hypothetical protein CVT25_000634 [Psilocybe cyanescens]|uniref:Uncharacterized protein n=1 Tax=Psilocybe cyanescens TaxID=93625 RepID=A0A409WZE7_PSICY|nr:hypothetical protein CVT25_000634 [Psilocybe cyanescens]